MSETCNICLESLAKCNSQCIDCHGMTKHFWKAEAIGLKVQLVRTEKKLDEAVELLKCFKDVEWSLSSDAERVQSRMIKEDFTKKIEKFLESVK